jgi:PKHD-type hydroxylase
MSYPIAPYPAMKDPNIAIARGVLKPGGIEVVRALGDEYLAKHGKPGEVGFHEGMRVHEATRACNSVWLPWPHEDPRVKTLYDGLGHIAQEANAWNWQFDIWGYQDNLHYVHYSAEHGPDGGKFNWHQDRGDDWRRMQRKLAVIVLLSDPADYEGGEFQIFDGREITVAPREQGTAYVLPSFTQHRVLPVTKGERRVLIGWLGGPRLR